jgi:hypothetical protein
VYTRSYCNLAFYLKKSIKRSIYAHEPDEVGEAQGVGPAQPIFVALAALAICEECFH